MIKRTDGRFDALEAADRRYELARNAARANSQPCYRTLFGLIPGDLAEAAQGRAKATRIEWADGTVELAPGAPADVADDLTGALDGLGERRSFSVRLATRTEVRGYRDDLIEAERDTEILDPPMYWVD